MTLFIARLPPRPWASYTHDVQLALGRRRPSSDVTENDLLHLPAPVQRYLRRVGVVGQPRVHNFRVRMHGRIRSGPTAGWMPLRAEQHNFVDEPARFFYLRASMFGLPVQGYHRYAGSTATMDIRLLGVVPVAHASGPEMDTSETVTLFNDMCIMAPATLIESSIEWTDVDDFHARARFTNAGHTIGAELVFNQAGALTDFSSDDRYRLSADGRTAKRARWSTPMREYRKYGAVCLSSGGEGRWRDPGSEYAYIELAIDEVQYNVGAFEAYEPLL